LSELELGAKPPRRGAEPPETGRSASRGAVRAPPPATRSGAERRFRCSPCRAWGRGGIQGLALDNGIVWVFALNQKIKLNKK
jgi:hypothetical protein